MAKVAINGLGRIGRIPHCHAEILRFAQDDRLCSDSMTLQQLWRVRAELAVTHFLVVVWQSPASVLKNVPLRPRSMQLLSTDLQADKRTFTGVYSGCLLVRLSLR